MAKNSNDNDTEQKQWIEETLNSLSGIKHAETDPFFFSRLEARMNRPVKATLFDAVLGWIAPVRAAFYTVLLLFVLNTVSVIYYSTEGSEATDLEAFAEEYGLYTGEQLYESILEE